MEKQYCLKKFLTIKKKNAKNKNGSPYAHMNTSDKFDWTSIRISRKQDSFPCLHLPSPPVPFTALPFPSCPFFSLRWWGTIFSTWI